jgi:hypothetical protein
MRQCIQNVRLGLSVPNSRVYVSASYESAELRARRIRRLRAAALPQREPPWLVWAARSRQQAAPRQQKATKHTPFRARSAGHRNHHPCRASHGVAPTSLSRYVAPSIRWISRQPQWVAGNSVA